MVKGSNSSAGTSVAIPAHVAGDLIVICAYRDGATALPTKPAAGGTVPAWVDIEAAAGANLNSMYVARFIATANNHTSGTWTNATGLSVIVISGADPAAPIGTHSQAGSASATGVVPVQSFVPTKGDGSSIFVTFAGQRTVTSWNSVDAGWTIQSSVATEVCCITKDTTFTDGVFNIADTVSASGGYRTQVVEVLTLPMRQQQPYVLSQAVSRLTR
jgi:hypothetical protein